MKTPVHYLIGLILGMSLATLASSQVLDIPSESAPSATDDVAALTLPGRGMNMDQVEARFGSPREKIEAVGEPPISRWVYSNFTVYFEYQTVLHAVTHQDN